MITSMILGFFTNGLYQVLFLFLVGTLIPMKNSVLMISGGVGIKNTVDLNGGIKYALDNIIKMPLYHIVYYVSIIAMIILIAKATNKQAILGVILFHTLFIVSPTAGKNLFNNAQIGEYFRVFVSYGVIFQFFYLY